MDEDRLNQFVGKALGDLGATLTAAQVVLGDKLGLYRAMAGAGPLSAADLAKRTETSERSVLEWLNAQAASGYVLYRSESGLYELPEEQAVVLADEESPFCMLGGFQAMLAAVRATPKVAEGFKTGKGVGWHEHDPDLFEGTERFFRPGYAANLMSSWIPALDGIDEKLRAGARVADVGCGHGASTILMAKAYPNSKFTGFDYHEPSLAAARRQSAAQGTQDQTDFQIATAQNYPGTYDLVAFFDCFHDMGDPSGAARHVRETLESDGAWMIVEPFAGDRVEDNLNPIGRVFYGASTLVCTPAALSQGDGTALGAQAGEARVREIVTGAGFRRFRRATETPFNIVYEAKP